MYSYKMVQVPSTISVDARKQKGNEAAALLNEIVNLNAVDGWEFYRVDPISVHEKPGCLGALSGKNEVLINYNVVTFRKPQ